MNAQLVEEMPIPSVLPAETDEDTSIEANEESTLGLVELLLKSPARLDARMNHDESRAPASIPRFLGIARRLVVKPEVELGVEQPAIQLFGRRIA